MASSPRCVECDAPITNQNRRPCWRCERAWKWLLEEQDEQLLIGWAYAEDRLREAGVGAWWLDGLRVASWQNRVLTLAGWQRTRRWVARRYVPMIQAIVNTDKDVVLLSPRPAATIARKIKREKEESNGNQMQSQDQS